MKKFMMGVLALMSVGMQNVWAQDEETENSEKMEFEYGVAADVVSTYMWRGQYNGGLSFQPDLSVGFANDNISVDLGTWWSIGATDWKFKKGLEKEEGYNPNTYLNKELDLYLTANIYGAIAGLTHYYYFDGTNYFNFGNKGQKGTAQTEFTLGYDFSYLFENVNLQLTWNTMFSGDDTYDGFDENRWDINQVARLKRAYSTYIEAQYAYEFNHGFTLTAAVGVSPWKGMYTDYEKNFALNNLMLRCDKMWTLKNDMKLSVYGQLMMNTCNLDKDNAVINGAGDDKLYMQKLMAGLGVRIEL